MNANESNLAVPLQTGEEWLIIFGMILVILSDFAKFPEVLIKHHGQYDGMCGHFWHSAGWEVWYQATQLFVGPSRPSPLLLRRLEWLGPVGWG